MLFIILSLVQFLLLFSQSLYSNHLLASTFILLSLFFLFFYTIHLLLQIFHNMRILPLFASLYHQVLLFFSQKVNLRNHYTQQKHFPQHQNHDLLVLFQHKVATSIHDYEILLLKTSPPYFFCTISPLFLSVKLILFLIQVPHCSKLHPEISQYHLNMLLLPQNLYNILYIHPFIWALLVLNHLLYTSLIFP